MLFTGIIVSLAGGAGTYALDFFTSGQSIAAVAAATVDAGFTDLSMSWIDGLSLNALASAVGADTLTSVIDATFPVQQLVSAWSDSTLGSGFRLDVETSATAVLVPASILFFGAALAGLGVMKRRGGAAVRA